MKKQIAMLLCALSALLSATTLPAMAAEQHYPISVGEYSIGAPDDYLFARPTSEDTIREWENPNVDRSKNTAVEAPNFGMYTNFLPGNGEYLTPNLVLGALGVGANQAGSAGGVSAIAGGYPVVNMEASYTAAAYTDVTSDLHYSNGSLGTIRIPSLGLTVNIYEGTDSATLAKGVGHFVGSSIWNGNCCLAAHNRGVNAYRAPGQERFTRSHCLGDSYTKEALRDRCTVRGGASAGAKKPFHWEGRKVNLLIDIQAKLNAGKGAGYERWAKIFNLKEAAKTLNFLIENGLADYDELTARAEQASERFDHASRQIKQLEARMGEVAQLKTHIINYSKTREVYAAYKKSRHKKEFRTEHEAEIAQHEAAKQAFDALGGKPTPKVTQLSEQYAALLAEKQEQYAEYQAARQDMLAYRTAKANVDKILSLEPVEQDAKTQQQETDR